MARPTVFCNGMRIRSLEEMKANYDFISLKESLKSGMLKRWLEDNNHIQEAQEVAAIDVDCMDLDVKLMLALGMSDEEQQIYLRKKEEEARRKAEEEAKHKAEEEARRKIEEEARRKAEEEARRKAEEEARRKAEILEEFYDLKKRKKVKMKVIYKVKNKSGHWLLIGESPDGRYLFKYISNLESNTEYKDVGLLDETKTDIPFWEH